MSGSALSLRKLIHGDRLPGESSKASMDEVQGHARLCLAVRYLKGPGSFPWARVCFRPLLGAKALNVAISLGLLLDDARFDFIVVYDEAERRFFQMIRLKGGGKA